MNKQWTYQIATLAYAVSRISILLIVALTLTGAISYAQPRGERNVPMGTAATFAVLGASTVTNTGATNVTGDVGVAPGTSITGFPPGILIGAMHAGDPVALQAQSDVLIAYNNVAGRACNTDLTGQDLGGLTLTEGVYCFSSSAQLTGPLTLDAQGNPDAQWVFQVGSTLTTASNASVQVINGGSACNVFWQVGSSATLGTDSTFVGNIVALASITLATGTDVSGRALAHTGAVTMDTNAVSLPVCSINIPTAVEISDMQVVTAPPWVSLTLPLLATGLLGTLLTGLLLKRHRHP